MCVLRGSGIRGKPGNVGIKFLLARGSQGFGVRSLWPSPYPVAPGGERPHPLLLPLHRKIPSHPPLTRRCVARRIRGAAVTWCVADGCCGGCRKPRRALPCDIDPDCLLASQDVGQVLLSRHNTHVLFFATHTQTL